jgi:hypothetical protein
MTKPAALKRGKTQEGAVRTCTTPGRHASAHQFPCLGELTIACRSQPQELDKRAPHCLDTAEFNCRGHLLDSAIRAFELTARRLHSHLQDVLQWRRADSLVAGCSAIQICSSRIDAMSDACEGNGTTEGSRVCRSAAEIDAATPSVTAAAPRSGVAGPCPER